MLKYKILKKIFPVKVSPEDSAVEYVCLPGRRLIFRNGIYDGWYRP